MLASVLARWGYEVEAAVDGQQAWELLREVRRPTLALLDWMMPGLTGPQLCQRLRKRETAPPLYIILVTSRTAHEDLLQGLQMGADDYVCKPYDVQELQVRVQVGLRMLSCQADMAEQEKLRGVLEMAGAVCHELNQPLQIASYHADDLLARLSGDDPHRESIQAIAEAVERLATLTRKVSQVSRYAATSYLSRTIVDLDKAADDAA